MFTVVLCPGTPEGSTGSGSGFKASQKTGQRLKVSSDRLGEAGNRTCYPWFTRHRFIPYTTATIICEMIDTMLRIVKTKLTQFFLIVGWLQYFNLFISSIPELFLTKLPKKSNA